MKTRTIFAAMLAATTMLASCAKDNEGNNDQADGQKAKLNIAIAAETRATGDAAADGSTINNFTAFIFDGAGNLEKRAPSDDGSNLTGASAVEVSTNAKTIYVVANAPTTGTWATALAAVSSKSALEGVIADLNVADGGSQTQAAIGRMATGTSNITFSQSGNDFTASETVTLTFVAARIQLSIVTSGDMTTHYDADASSDGSLKITGVAVLNAGGTSKLFGTSLVPATKKYYTGIDKESNFVYWPAVGAYTVTGSLLKNAVTATNATTLAAAKFHYYVFENDAVTAATFPTIVTLVGEYDGEAMYFPVHLAPYEDFTNGSSTFASVTRGQSYNITITLTGDPRFPGGNPGGTEEPTNPLVKASVAVSVQLTDWTPITLGKEF